MLEPPTRHGTMMNLVRMKASTRAAATIFSVSLMKLLVFTTAIIQQEKPLSGFLFYYLTSLILADLPERSLR